MNPCGPVTPVVSLSITMHVHLFELSRRAGMLLLCNKDRVHSIM